MEGRYLAFRRYTSVRMIQTVACAAEEPGSSLKGRLITAAYLEHCHARSQTPHPARLPSAMAGFFIKFLSEPGFLLPKRRRDVPRGEK